MNGLFFYIGLGAGLAAACGLRPFLPLLLAGALGSAGALGVGFAPARFHFLQDGLVAGRGGGRVRGSATRCASLRLDPERFPEADRRTCRVVAGVGLGAGALLFAGTLAAHGDACWPGLLGGVLPRPRSRSARPARSSLGARSRLPDRAAREALTIYLDAASLLLAALVALLHPLGYVAVALLAWLLVAHGALAPGRSTRACGSCGR